jgi:hypothetical protein
LHEVLALPIEDRADIAAELLASLEEADDPAEVEARGQPKSAGARAACSEGTPPAIPGPTCAAEF